MRGAPRRDIVPPMRDAADSDPMFTLRRLLLALVLLGIVGLSAELLLLEHTESWTQWIPLVLLAVALVVGTLAWVRPGRMVLRALQLTMLSFVVAGFAGLVLHYRGNMLFELEGDPAAHGWDLVWRSLRGGVPTLAPAAMAQLGLLGLLHAYRHPGLKNRE